MDGEKIQAVKKLIMDELDARSPDGSLMIQTIYPKLEKMEDATRIARTALDQLVEEDLVEVRRGMTFWQARVTKRQE
jgi:hypothetical protein